MRGILTAARDSFLSADDGDVYAVQTHGNSQAIEWFGKDSVYRPVNFDGYSPISWSVNFICENGMRHLNANLCQEF
jgi:hypothetical protein